MPTYEDIRVGDLLPVLTKTPDRLDLVRYAAGSGDFNPLHFDPDDRQALSLGNNIVHGRFKFAALGEAVSNWLAHNGEVRAISCQYRGMDAMGATFSCRGVVVATDSETRRVDLELWTEDSAGRRTTTGRAQVLFPPPEVVSA